MRTARNRLMSRSRRRRRKRRIKRARRVRRMARKRRRRIRVPEADQELKIRRNLVLRKERVNQKSRNQTDSPKNI